MYPWQVIKYFNGNVNMNHHGEDPDNLGGLGDMLPADVLKKLNNLLEQLHRAEHPQPGSNIINIYTSGNQHIDNQYVFDGKVLEKSFKTNQREGELNDGHWWGNISWSVAYRIYQMMGYQGTVSQFVRDVSQWPFTMPIRYDCNDDAVSKPIRTGKMSRSLDKWAEDGASSQFIILGKELMKALAQGSFILRKFGRKILSQWKYLYFEISGTRSPGAVRWRRWWRPFGAMDGRGN